MGIRIDFLSRMITGSELLEGDFLSDMEKDLILHYFVNGKEVSQIAKEVTLSEQRVRKVLDNSINKVLLRISELSFRSKYLDKVIAERDNIELENKNLRVKFKKYLKDENQIMMDFESVNESIELLRFSVRAKRILEELNIDKVKDLSRLSLHDLNNKHQIGRKTIAEIISKCENYGIKIA